MDEQKDLAQERQIDDHAAKAAALAELARFSIGQIAASAQVTAAEAAVASFSEATRVLGEYLEQIPSMLEGARKGCASCHHDDHGWGLDGTPCPSCWAGKHLACALEAEARLEAAHKKLRAREEDLAQAEEVIRAHERAAAARLAAAEPLRPVEDDTDRLTLEPLHLRGVEVRDGATAVFELRSPPRQDEPRGTGFPVVERDPPVRVVVYLAGPSADEATRYLAGWLREPLSLSFERHEDEPPAPAES